MPCSFVIATIPSVIPDGAGMLCSGSSQSQSTIPSVIPDGAGTLCSGSSQSQSTIPSVVPDGAGMLCSGSSQSQATIPSVMPDGAVGSSGSGIAGARQLTAPGTDVTTAVASPWNDDDQNTQDAWHFGTTGQAPALQYADYDGAGTEYGCGTTTGTIATIPSVVPDGAGMLCSGSSQSQATIPSVMPDGAVGASGSGIAGARQLTAPGTGATTAVASEWNDDDQNTQDAWHFGTTGQAPALQYADYDGAGTEYGCGTTTGTIATIPSVIPTVRAGTITIVCGTTLLPGQER